MAKLFQISLSNIFLLITICALILGLYLMQKQVAALNQQVETLNKSVQAFKSVNEYQVQYARTCEARHLALEKAVEDAGLDKATVSSIKMTAGLAFAERLIELSKKEKERIERAK